MQGKAKTMQAAFEALFQMNGAPNNAALFASHDEHFEKYYFYFSPGAAEPRLHAHWSRAMQGCPSPHRFGTSTHRCYPVGHSDAREALLRSTEPG